MYTNGTGPPLIEAQSKILTLQDILKERITHKSDIIPVRPIVQIQGKNFATQGDISFISGLPKAGKTAIAINILATAFLSEIPPDLDTLDIRTTCAESKNVFFFDTEQNPSDTAKLEQSIRRMLDIDKTPDNLHIFNLRKYKRAEKKNILFEFIDAFPNMHLCMIDGLADLARDPNQTELSFDLIDEFMIESEKRPTSFILYMHLNPNSNKMRGNLGSEAERKARAVISVSKNRKEDIHTIECTLIRGSAEFGEIHCRYNESAGRLLKLESDEVKNYKIKTDRKQIRANQLYSLAKKCLLGGTEQIKHVEFVNRILNHSLEIMGKTYVESGAKKLIEQMESAGIVIKEDKKYSLSIK